MKKGGRNILGVVGPPLEERKEAAGRWRRVKLKHTHTHIESERKMVGQFDVECERKEKDRERIERGEEKASQILFYFIFQKGKASQI